MRNDRVENAVEAICNRGCRYVNSVLSNQENHQDFKELSDLNSMELSIVFRELDAVMAVYSQSGGCEI